jgi:hypothetical protein
MKERLLVAILAFMALALILGGVSTMSAGAALPGEKSLSARLPTASNVQGPFVSQAVKSDVSPPMRSLPVMTEQELMGEGQEMPLFPIPGSDQASVGLKDSVLQSVLGPLVMPTPIANFNGMINFWGVYPPDTVGDVGPNHYLQMVNSTGVQIFDKSGNTIAGPYNYNQLFRGFGGICETNQQGDPIVLHDQMADRWFLSQFAYPSQQGPTFQCIALSTSSDPTGSYYLYAFQTATVGFDDYPHYGVWPDAYYFSANRFNAPGFAGAAGAFERERMLVGDPTARQVIFLTPGQAGHLPSDLDGGTLPPPNSPNFYLYPTNAGTGTISEYKFDVEWSNPPASTFTGPFPITVAPWDSDLCAATREQCIDQPGTSVRLEAIADRFMHRLAYRNFGTHESLVVKHTVDADGAGRAGIRWYEFRNPNAPSPTVYQQGTFAPADGLHRWMGSIAMDRQGNMAAGYSVSSTTVFPGIRYAGRLVSDPLGQFAQGEGTLLNGGGSQTGPGARWGDYSSMNIDPRDDCTFWYTTEFYSVTGVVNWKTRIGSFRYPGCTGATATPVPSATGTPPTQTSTPLATPTLCPGGLNTTGTINQSDPTQMSAVVGGSATQCGQTPACPGMSGIPDPRHFDSYTLTNNTGSAQCVTVSIDALACGEAGVGSVAYMGSFDPNAVCTNYLASSGSNGPRYSYSFTVPAGMTYVVVVRELSPGAGCALYNIRINPCTLGQLTPSPVVTAPPTNTSILPTLTTVPTSPPSTSTAVGTITSIATTNTATSVATATTGQSTATATACTITFTDVPPTDPFYANIRCLACRGIISGYADGTFRPYNNITRGQIAKVVSNAAGFSEPVSGQTYEDVLPTNTFYEFIERLSQRGHMGGYPCGQRTTEPCNPPENRPYFRPVENATRGQLSKIVSNAAGWNDDPGPQRFEDVPPEHPFFVWIQRLANRSAIGGYPCGGPGEPCVPPESRPYFRPGNPVTRGQASRIVANTFYPNCQTP